jgi:4-amino-4-deoxy-L-arabinose transferase-like glycosyltransferase
LRISWTRRQIWALFPLIGVALLLPRLLLWVQISTAFVAWPWQFDLAEGVNLDATLKLAQGSNIYRHNGPDSFLSAPYTPLFYIFNAPFTWVTGPSFGVGRALSLVSTLAIAVLLFYVVWMVTSVRSAGVLAGALWLSISPVIVWSALYLQHIPALALGLSLIQHLTLPTKA